MSKSSEITWLKREIRDTWNSGLRPHRCTVDPRWKQLVNIILIGIDSLSCERTVMPKSADNEQPMKEECCFFFFVNRRLPACRLLSVHLLALRDLRHTPSLRSLIPLNNAGRIRHLPVSLSLCLSLSRLSLFQIQITSAHAKTVQPGSGSLTGQVWTKCQLFPVHPRLDTLAGASERSKGQDDNRQPGVIDLPAKYELNPSYSFRFYFCNISVSLLNVTLYKSFIHAGKLNRHDVNCSKFSDFL